MGRILYILPAAGYTGGANSVVQEAAGLLRMGLDVSIAVDRRNHAEFAGAYAGLPAVTAAPVLATYDDPAGLAGLLATSKVAICTVATSVPAVIGAWEHLPEADRPRLFYYIQDYEPLFFDPGTEDWTAACRSYEFGGILQGMAKTDWLRDTVEARHSIRVSRVKASIDHGVYFPYLAARGGDQLVLAAMLRPHTPRRAPRRTCRLLNRLAAELGSRVRLVVFGCGPEEMREHGLMLDPAIERHGRIIREQVARILRRTDLFLDLSDYQAFGRTGLEAMACGAAALLPVHGGAGEYVVHGENGYLADTRDEDGLFHTVEAYAAQAPSTRRAMAVAAMATAADYNVEKACISVLGVLLGTR
ncbi:hypothetical protein VY88_29270 [Azospirillum thiophilum]|uniref:Glycosyl transferase family 1 domain-containing protein n=1 Tax=Azospirillum thiophilum TaxID=528244 RepID=A0AAC8W4H0_9PROT|nr:hypothetical protein AL072_27525 [Azospirillum thiophilum]KJR61885.1 hypothetical protein VY88_29270 [Azospirillum thiophilum]